MPKLKKVIQNSNFQVSIFQDKLQISSELLCALWQFEYLLSATFSQFKHLHVSEQFK